MLLAGIVASSITAGIELPTVVISNSNEDGSEWQDGDNLTQVGPNISITVAGGAYDSLLWEFLQESGGNPPSGGVTNGLSSETTLDPVLISNTDGVYMEIRLTATNAGGSASDTLIVFVAFGA